MKSGAATTSGIRERDWKVLLDSLYRRDCVVLLGPNVSTTDGNGAPASLSIGLSRHLADILESEEDVKVEDPDNFPLVAQVFVNRKTREDLEAEVDTFYDDLNAEFEKGNRRDEVLEHLASLPLPIFISSRHDQILQQCLRRSGKDPLESSYNFRGDQKSTVGQLGKIEQPLVYHLAGNTDDPASLVLTESDLLDFLEAIVSGNPALPTDLRNQFREKSFLFLGCGLHKYYLRVLVHVLGLSRSGRRSFAVENLPAEADLTSRESVWFYKVGYRSLKMLHVPEDEFLSELRRRWDNEYPGGAIAGVAAKPADRPKVFLSYMSEDVDFARRMAIALEQHGIEPWLDKPVSGQQAARWGLEVGEDWEVGISEAIGKEVDFFVVLVGQHFGEGVDTVVHAEIKLALKRASRRGALKFIYPIQIDDSSSIPVALAQIHALRFQNFETDFVDLSKDIKRQFAKLQRR